MSDTVLTIVITPCLLGFDVRTYNAREVAPGSWHGSGFHRHLGILSAHDLINRLIWTEEPFRVVVSDHVPRLP